MIRFVPKGRLDKTTTARHRETSNREFGTSESCNVMVLTSFETLMRTKILLTSNRCYMAQTLSD
jgi:hypothetical protein